MENKNKFEYDGMQRLKKEDPELYKTWQEARQQRQKEEERQKKAQKQHKPQRGKDEHER